MNRLESTIDVALQIHLPKHLELGRLVIRGHGHVGVIPIAPDAVALEAIALAIDGFEGKGLGLVAQLDRGQVSPCVRIHGLKYFQLDGQAMAIPAGHVAYLAALEQLILIDRVLENFVEGVANVQIAIGVGWPIVEHKHLAGVVDRQRFVDLVLGPKGLNLRLALGSVGPHVKAGLGQQNGVFVAFGVCHGLGLMRGEGWFGLLSQIRPWAPRPGHRFWPVLSLQ